MYISHMRHMQLPPAAVNNKIHNKVQGNIIEEKKNSEKSNTASSGAKILPTGSTWDTEPAQPRDVSPQAGCQMDYQSNYEGGKRQNL